jgi:sortase A
MPDFEASLETGDDPGDARSDIPIAPTAGSPPSPLGTDPPAAGDTIALLPDHIVIPALGVDAPVVEVGWEARIVNDGELGNVWQTADYAAGYHRQSAPIGRAGNTVISGHNNIKGAVFKDLYDLKTGDPIFLYSGDRTWAYVVTNKFVVREEGASPERRTKNARWIDPTPDERLTLVSCYPQWANTHRVVVVARPTMAAAAQAGSTEPMGSGSR